MTGFTYYRPVALTSVVKKSFEKLVIDLCETSLAIPALKRCTAFCNTLNIGKTPFCRYQPGIQHHHSRSLPLQITKFTEMRSINSGTDQPFKLTENLSTIITDLIQHIFLFYLCEALLYIFNHVSLFCLFLLKIDVKLKTQMKN